MKTVNVTSFGGPEVLETVDVADPAAGPGEVVVAVSAADVLAIDTALRNGDGREYFAMEPPFVPGTSVAGTVRSVGEGVDGAWLGRRVVAITGVTGGYAERVAVAERELIAVPDELGLDDAAALTNDGRTALALIEASAVQAQEWVLVMPAGSGLGLLLVQFAHALGARVIGAARGAAKLELARGSGAESTVDYTETDWAERVRQTTGQAGVDVVLDGVGGAIGLAAFDVTARGGRFAGYGDSSGSYIAYDADQARERGVRLLGPEYVHIGGTDEAKRLAERALSAAAAGKIKPFIGQTFPLEQATRAHQALRAREAKGRTLLIVDPSRRPATT